MDRPLKQQVLQITFFSRRSNFTFVSGASNQIGMAGAKKIMSEHKRQLKYFEIPFPVFT